MRKAALRKNISERNKCIKHMEVLVGLGIKTDIRKANKVKIEDREYKIKIHCKKCMTKMSIEFKIYL